MSRAGRWCSFKKSRLPASEAAPDTGISGIGISGGISGAASLLPFHDCCEAAGGCGGLQLTHTEGTLERGKLAQLSDVHVEAEEKEFEKERRISSQRSIINKDC